MIQSGLIEGEWNSGLSALGINRAFQSADEGISTLLLTTEYDERTSMLKCIHRLCGINPYELHEGQSKEDEAKVLSDVKYPKNAPIKFFHIEPPTENTLDALHEFINKVITVGDKFIQLHGIKHIIVDRIPSNEYFIVIRELKGHFLPRNIALTLIKTGIKGTPLHFEPFNYDSQFNHIEEFDWNKTVEYIPSYNELLESEQDYE
jgi:hypothetical protein